jgi:hypothetical protein
MTRQTTARTATERLETAKNAHVTARRNARRRRLATIAAYPVFEPLPAIAAPVIPTAPTTAAPTTHAERIAALDATRTAIAAATAAIIATRRPVETETVTVETVPTTRRPAAAALRIVNIRNLYRLRDADAARRDPTAPRNRYTLYVGRNGRRPSPLANPYHIGTDGDRATVIEKYRHWLHAQLQTETPAAAAIAALADRVRAGEYIDLVCHCAPEPCHAEIIARAVEWIIATERTTPDAYPMPDVAPAEHAHAAAAPTATGTARDDIAPEIEHACETGTVRQYARTLYLYRRDDGDGTREVIATAPALTERPAGTIRDAAALTVAEYDNLTAALLSDWLARNVETAIDAPLSLPTYRKIYTGSDAPITHETTTHADAYADDATDDDETDAETAATYTDARNETARYTATETAANRLQIDDRTGTATRYPNAKPDALPNPADPRIVSPVYRTNPRRPGTVEILPVSEMHKSRPQWHAAPAAAAATYAAAFTAHRAALTVTDTREIDAYALDADPNAAAIEPEPNRLHLPTIRAARAEHLLRQLRLEGETEPYARLINAL